MKFYAFIVYIDYALHASIWISKLCLWPLTLKASLYSHCFSCVETFFQINSFTLFGMWLWIYMLLISHIFVILKPAISYHIWMLVLLLLIEIPLKNCFHGYSAIGAHWISLCLYITLSNSSHMNSLLIITLTFSSKQSSFRSHIFIRMLSN